MILCVAHCPAALPRPSSAASDQTPGATAHLNPATMAKLTISQQFGNTSGSYK
jgi:hypothetical protein